MPTKKLSIRYVLCLFLAVSLTAIGLMVAFTMGPQTLEELRQVRLADLFLAFALAGLSLGLDGMTLRLLASAAGAEIGLFYSIKSILFYLFLSTITPTISGGEPLLLFQLTRKGMSTGTATTVIFLRGIMILSIIAVATPIIVFFHGELIGNIIFKGLFRTVALFLAVLLCTAAFVAFFPLQGGKMLTALAGWLERFPHMARHGRKAAKTIKSLLEDFRLTLGMIFSASKKRLLAAMFCCTFSLMANFLIAYAVLDGLHCRIPVQQVLMIQFVLYFLLYFTPTPGGSGIAEGGCYALFADFVPRHILGVYVILWRFFTVYMWAFVGGSLVVKSLGFSRLDRVAAACDQSKGNEEAP